MDMNPATLNHCKSLLPLVCNSVKAAPPSPKTLNCVFAISGVELSRGFIATSGIELLQG